jgi:hypothetical protein
MSRKKEQKMIVVNTDHNLVAILRNRFEAQIKGFYPERIIRVCESSDIVMNKLLKKIIISENS